MAQNDFNWRSKISWKLPCCAGWIAQIDKVLEKISAIILKVLPFRRWTKTISFTMLDNHRLSANSLVQCAISLCSAPSNNISRQLFFRFWKFFAPRYHHLSACSFIISFKWIKNELNWRKYPTWMHGAPQLLLKFTWKMKESALMIISWLLSVRVNQDNFFSLITYKKIAWIFLRLFFHSFIASRLEWQLGWVVRSENSTRIFSVLSITR